MRIVLKDTTLTIIDVQEKLIPHMYEKDILLSNLRILIKGVQSLNMSIIMTEQVPDKLGNTVNEVSELLPNIQTIKKHEFSCYANEEYRNKIQNSSYKNIILCGMETHICALQTAVDLKQNGYNPIMVWDALSSRTLANKNIALERFRQEGIMITSIESILFELLYTFENSSAREISKLIK